MITVCLDVSGSDWIDLMPGSGPDTGAESILTLCSVGISAADNVFIVLHGASLTLDITGTDY